MSERKRRAENDPWTKLKNRPVRSGMWFICHKENVELFQYEEAMNIYDEFFRFHPNGLDATIDFMVLKLSYEMVNEQLHHIRMSSYRWAGVKSIVEGLSQGEESFACPDNYMWFFDLIRERKMLGWVDFIANIGVNCPTSVVIGYMGSLYARLPTVGGWMYNLTALEESLNRGWIYQEMAFGPLDQQGILNLFGLIRNRFMTFRENENKTEQQLHDVLHAVCLLDRLLSRRGFYDWNKKYPQFKTFSYPFYGGGGFRRRTADTLIINLAIPANIRVIKVIDAHTSFDIVSVVCCDVFSCMDEDCYQSNVKAISDILIQPTYVICRSADEFEEYYFSAVEEYYGTALTFESDRLPAIFSVAISIFKETFSQEINLHMILKIAWKALFEKLVEACMGCRSTAFTTFTLLNKRTEHCGQLGFTVRGSKIENNLSYSVMKDGEKVSISAMKNICRVSEEMVVKYRRDGTSTYQRADGVLLEVFACEPPEELQEYCKKKGTFTLFFIAREKQSKVIWRLRMKTFYLERFPDYAYPPSPEEEFD